MKKRKAPKSFFSLNFSRPLSYYLNIKLEGTYNVSGKEEKVNIELKTDILIKEIKRIKNAFPVIKLEFSNYSIQGELGSYLPPAYILELFLQKSYTVNLNSRLRKVRNFQLTNRLLYRIIERILHPTKKTKLSETESTESFHFRLNGITYEINHNKIYEYSDTWNLKNIFYITISGLAQGRAKLNTNIIYNNTEKTLDYFQSTLDLNYNGNLIQKNNKIQSGILKLHAEMKMELK